MNCRHYGSIPTRFLVSVVLCVLLSAVLLIAAKTPGDSQGFELLMDDTVNLVLEMDGNIEPECRNRTIVKTEAIRPPTISSPSGERKPLVRRQERWYVDRCGKQFTWDIQYNPSGIGGTSIAVGLTSDSQIAPTLPLLAKIDRLESDQSTRRIFLVTSDSDGGPGSLAQAIVDANAFPNMDGPDLILFKLPNPGPATISLVAALPAITDAVVINGFSQPGSMPNTLAEGDNAVLKVVLDGSGLIRPAHGLLLRAGSSTVRGLKIQGFGGDGIRIERGGSNRIEGNLLGSGPEEARGSSNAGSGVAVVDSSDNVIGGFDPSSRNAIEGNGSPGVRISGAGSINNAILGNRIVRNEGKGVGLESDMPGIRGDRGPGPNRLQRAPVLTSVSFAPTGEGRRAEVVVQGVLDGDPVALYTLELFATSSQPPVRRIGGSEKQRGAHAFSEGERFLTSMEVTTGQDGKVGFQVHLPRGIHSGDWVTATATDRDGSTSEFSAPVATPTFTIRWNTASGSWGTDANWEPPQVPWPTDDVLIAENGAHATFTVTVDTPASANSLTLGGGSGTQTLSIIASRTLTLNAASSVGTTGVLSHSGGTIALTGDLTIDGTCNWSGGTMTGAGTTTINGSLNLSGAGTKQLTGGRRLHNAGAANWMDTGAVRFAYPGGGFIDNTGTWDAQGDAAFTKQITGEPGTFNNVGTFRKSAGSITGVATNVPFTNSGLVEIQSGTLEIAGDGSNTGRFNISAATGTLLFSGANGTTVFNFDTGSTIAGPGRVLLSGPGTVSVNSTVSTPVETTFEIEAGGALGGSGTLTTAGVFNWSAVLNGPSTMTGTGTTTINGSLNLFGAGTKFLSAGRTLHNNQAVRWAAGNVSVGASAVINNTGTWDDLTDASMFASPATTPQVFNNFGTFKKSGGSGTTSVSIPFTNSGTVDVQSGTLSLTMGESTGAFIVSAVGGFLQFGGGNSGDRFNLKAGSGIAGPGTLRVGGNGRVDVTGAVSAASATRFRMEGSTLGGTGTLTIAGDMNWSGGTMTDQGVTMINGPFNLNGSVNLTQSRTLNNNLAAMWTAGTLQVATAAVINNNGTWDVLSDSSMRPPPGTEAGAFNNLGTFTKLAGSGTTSVSIPFTNGGTVDVQIGILNVSSSNYSQTAGITKLTGGGLSSTTNINIQGGTLAGLGTVTGPVIVSATGALAPGPPTGTLSIVGDYTHSGPAPSGAFSVEIGGTSPGLFDRADISGNGSVATLAGALDVNLDNFTPDSGDSFTIMTYPSHIGTFTPNLPVVGCIGWRLTYGSISLVLTAVDVPAEVTALTLLANRVGLVWDPAPIRPGTVYDVLRGDIDKLPVGPGGDETCLAEGITATTATDPAVPALGRGFWYLVREELPDCGTGTYGLASNGTERMSTACP